MPGRRRTVHFVATSAHELDRRGLTAYLAAHASLARDARCWVHLGSSIGAQEPAMRVGASDGALLALAERSLTASGIEGYEALEPGDPGIGEAREVDEAGGRIITFHGTHPFFHSPNDTVEMAVDPDSVARWTRAAWDIVCALIEEEG